MLFPRRTNYAAVVAFPLVHKVSVACRYRMNCQRLRRFLRSQRHSWDCKELERQMSQERKPRVFLTPPFERRWRV